MHSFFLDIALLVSLPLFLLFGNFDLFTMFKKESRKIIKIIRKFFVNETIKYYTHVKCLTLIIKPSILLKIRLLCIKLIYYIISNTRYSIHYYLSISHLFQFITFLHCRIKNLRYCNYFFIETKQ